MLGLTSQRGPPWRRTRAFMRLLVLALLLREHEGDAFARTINQDLRPQLKDDKARIISRNDFFAMALDGRFIFRFPHGPGKANSIASYKAGYWINTFAELNPNEKLSLNGRVALVSPAPNTGIIANSYFYPFASVSWKDNLSDYSLPDIGVKVRIFDLDRQTLGAGLTLEDKEMSGLNVEFSYDDIRLRYLFNRGSYDLVRDINYFQVDLADNLLGIALTATSPGNTISDKETYEKANASLKSPASIRFLSVYSVAEIMDDTYISTEVSRANMAFAGLIGYKQEMWLTPVVQALFKAQLRHYQDGFAAGIAGNVQHDYLSVEQENKDFTNSANIFTVDDNVTVGALRGDLRFDLTDWFSLFTQNEVAHFKHKTTGLSKNYFFKHGFSVCPRENDNECLDVFYSNKVINGAFPLNSEDAENKLSLRRTNIIGLEARFRF